MSSSDGRSREECDCREECDWTDETFTPTQMGRLPITNDYEIRIHLA